MFERLWHVIAPWDFGAVVLPRYPGFDHRHLVLGQSASLHDDVRPVGGDGGGCVVVGYNVYIDVLCIDGPKREKFAGEDKKEKQESERLYLANNDLSSLDGQSPCRSICWWRCP